MLERLKILFFGADWDEIELYEIENGHIQKKVIHDSEKSESALIQKEKHKIVVIQFKGCHFNKNKVIYLIKSLPHDNIISYYFLLKSRKQLNLFKDIVSQLIDGEIDTYGIDPCYFFSLVPLNGDGHKTIGKYVQNLKKDVSIWGITKNTIRNYLINIGLSNMIYEEFIISVKNH